MESNIKVTKMKKLLIVDVPKWASGIRIVADGGVIPSIVLSSTEITFTTSEINYLLTLHNMNENGIHFAPVPDIEDKLRGML